MKYEKSGTLAYFESIPQIKQISLADVPVPNTTESYSLYKKTAGEVLPDQQAVNFYVLNHLAALVKAKFTKHETLPPWANQIMEEYTKELAMQGSRMFYYMLIICTRESRHASNVTVGLTNSAFKEWQKSIKGKGSTEAALMFTKSPPSFNLGVYTKFMMDVFDNCSFSSGYGGKKWGEIARVLHRFAIGEYSMEMLVDTGYTLAHNGGPIFNKGFLYMHYTAGLNKILDVQRSGQMPEYVLDVIEAGNPTGDALVTEKLRALVMNYKYQFPEEFGDYVDWHKVTKLGGMGNYSMQKKAQDKKHATKHVGEAIGEFHVDGQNTVKIVKAIRKQTSVTQGV